MISKNKKYRTRDGREPQGLTQLSNGMWGYWIDNTPVSVHSNGRLYGDCKAESQLDLIEVKEKHEGWINVYKDGVCGSYPNKNMADQDRGTSRIACIKIEYEEGEGL
jgi:hypothetical protein